VALSVGAPRGHSSRVYPRPNRGYAASRPAVFGLSSPSLRRERSPTLLKRAERNARQHETQASIRGLCNRPVFKIRSMRQIATKVRPRFARRNPGSKARLLRICCATRRGRYLNLVRNYQAPPGRGRSLQSKLHRFGGINSRTTPSLFTKQSERERRRKITGKLPFGSTTSLSLPPQRLRSTEGQLN
jgi:hypothetical protein